MIRKIINKMISAKKEMNAWNNLIRDSGNSILEVISEKHSFVIFNGMSTTEAERLLECFESYK